MCTTPKRSSARCWRRATRRWRRRKTPTWCSTTPAASATRPSRRSSTACRISSARPARARSSACWDAWRSRKARRSSTARRTSAWWPARPAIPGCGEMLVQLEAGNRRVTGLSLDTDETFDTPFTRRDNPHRAYITIIEGCDKSCAYCVVPFTRGPERSRTSESVMAEARRLAGTRLHRDPVAGPEREQLPRSLARRLGFRHAAGARRRDSRHPPRALHHLASARFRQAPSSTPWTPTRCSAITSTCRCSPAPVAGARRHGPALHARRVHARASSG